MDANFYIAWTAMGLAQLQAGLAQDAIASFTRVVELVPWFSSGAWNLALAYHQAGDS
jgi:tetratricopeptide (TPR) repeat protein